MSNRAVPVREVWKAVVQDVRKTGVYRYSTLVSESVRTVRRVLLQEVTPTARMAERVGYVLRMVPRFERKA